MSDFLYVTSAVCLIQVLGLMLFFLVPWKPRILVHKLSDSSPAETDKDPEGRCWYGWSEQKLHGNPRMWNAGWGYSSESRGSTHWAPYWAFPVVEEVE